MNIKEPIQELALEYLKNSNDYNFGRLYNRLAPGLRRHIWSFIRNIKDYDLLEEVLQKTWEKVLLKRDQYDESKGMFSSWIYTIAKNESLMEYYKHKNFVSFEKLFKLDDNNDEFVCDILLKQIKSGVNSNYILSNEYNGSDFDAKRREIRTIVLYEMCRLPDIYFKILTDNLICRKKYKDLSLIYDIPLNTVKTRIKLGKKILVNRLIDRSIDISALSF